VASQATTIPTHPSTVEDIHPLLIRWILSPHQYTLGGTQGRQITGSPTENTHCAQPRLISSSYSAVLTDRP